MKVCNHCKETKTIDSFSNRAKSVDGKHPWCKECKRAYDNAYYASKPQRRLDIVAANDQRKRKNMRYVWEYLLENPCACGEADPVVLQFDHNDGVDKVDNVSSMVKGGRKTLEREIKKCTVRCANCHARRTAEQFGWYRHLNEE